MSLHPQDPSTGDELEGRLRTGRPQPSAQLVDEVVASVGRPRRRGSTRAVLAASLSVVIVGALSSFGGIGYAASHTNDLVQAAFGNQHGNGPASAADDQYRPGKGCGDKNHIHVPKPGQSPCPN